MNLVHIRIVIYGYARVSTDSRSMAAQVAALTTAGAEKVFRETASGAKTNRTQRCRTDRLVRLGDGRKCSDHVVVVSCWEGPLSGLKSWSP